MPPKQKSNTPRNLKSERQTKGKGPALRPSLRSGRSSWLWWTLPTALLVFSVTLQTTAPHCAKLLHLSSAGSLFSRFMKVPGLKTHTLQYEAANGLFPRGCKWRAVRSTEQERKFWAKETYEYWNEHRGAWSPAQPPECRVRGQTTTKGWRWRRGSPRTQVACDDNHCLYENLWYNNGYWYLLVGDGDMPVDWWQMTRNLELRVLHIQNASAFAQGVDHQVIPGDTLIFDYLFFSHPTAIGHWGEMMFPLYSILREEEEFSVPPDRFLLLHLKRVHLLEWARAIIFATLGLGPGQELTPLVMQQEHDEIGEQILQPLEGIAADQWLCFERALVLRDTLSGGVRTFLKQEDAQAFRRAVYRNHGLEAPKQRLPPRLITFQRKRTNRRIVNEAQLIRLLQKYAEVQIVEFESSTPFKEQLEVISRTGVFVSVHTSNLANAQFLQPGSAVIEIIQRNWVWHDMDRTFQAHTEKMGDIHHFAWRARFRNQTVYIDPRDGERFGNWPAYLCKTEDCVEAHTNVDVVVNLQELEVLLETALPRVFNGTSVGEAAMPWPEEEPEPEGDPRGGLEEVLRERGDATSPPEPKTAEDADDEALYHEYVEKYGAPD